MGLTELTVLNVVWILILFAFVYTMLSGLGCKQCCDKMADSDCLTLQDIDEDLERYCLGITVCIFIVLVSANFAVIQ